MGKGLLLGILDGIGEILGNLFGWLINTLVSPLIQMMIKAIFNVAKYVFGYYFYLASVFLLQLIDFVELLFRSLAGLGSNSPDGAGFIFTYEDAIVKSNDLLIQMLLSPTVLQAFYSCAIVGVFLLIITTVFQMIKVEYTTEGAQNSKTSILGKSLKSVSNLLLIPALTIFGVFIGNSVLDLIDTATGNGEKSTISGLLWSTAATEAMWNTQLDGGNNYVFTGTGTLYAGAIVLAIGEIFNPTDESLGSRLLFGNPSEERERDVSDKFISGEFRYNHLTDVTRNYNLFEVNYLVLIFGACMIIKCLFFTCFGLIDRLYQCLALFIISPFVIGMTPVKDSLGAWRTKFIQKALSAYGIVISINLFFILISLFINMNIKFVAPWNYLGFRPTFLTGLIKCMFLIVGCLMIEKLAPDLGQYFGAGNAMAEGKGLATEATKGLVTAAKVGVGIATGGAGLAVKMAKGGAGFVRTIGGAAQGAVQGARQGGGIRGFFSGMVRGGADAGGVNRARRDVSNAVADADAAQEKYDEATKDIKTEDIAEYRQHRDAHANALEKYRTLKKKKDAGGLSISESRELDAQLEAAKAEVKTTLSEKNKFSQTHNGAAYELAAQAEDELIAKKGALSDARSNLADAQSNKDKAPEKLGQRVRDRVQASTNAITQIGRDGISSMIPGPLRQVRNDWNQAMEKGNSYSDESKQAYENIKKEKADKAAEKHNARLFNSMINAINRNKQAQIIGTATVERFEAKQAEIKKNFDTWEQRLAEAAKSLADAIREKKSASEIKSAESEVEYVKSQLRQLDPKIKFENNQVVSAHIELDLGDFKTQIQEAVKKGATVDQINEIIKNNLKKWGEQGNEGIVKELRKAVEEIKNEIK